MKQRKKIIGVVLTIALVLGLLFTVPFKASAAATTVTTYQELAAALDGTSPVEIKLERDIDIPVDSNPVTIAGKTVSIDLDGNQLRGNLRIESGELNISDGSSDGKVRGNVYVNGGTFNLNSGTLWEGNSDGVVFVNDGAVFNMSG